MTTDNTIDPIDFDFDLDTAEPEQEVRPPFRTNISGHVIQMVDPTSIDWRDLMDVDDPIKFLKYALTDEKRSDGKTDAEFLREWDAPAWKFGALVKKYMEHFDFDPASMAPARGAAKRL